MEALAFKDDEGQREAHGLCGPRAPRPVQDRPEGGRGGEHQVAGKSYVAIPIRSAYDEGYEPPKVPNLAALEKLTLESGWPGVKFENVNDERASTNGGVQTACFPSSKALWSAGRWFTPTAGGVMPDWRRPRSSRISAPTCEPSSVARRRGWGPARGIGVAVPGPLDLRSGTVTAAPHVAAWRSFPLRARLESELHRRITLENDANAWALGEFWRGAARGRREVVLLTLGTGVGGGLVVNGKIIHGIAGMAGELGHVTVSDPTACDATVGRADAWRPTPRPQGFAP